MDEGPSSFRRPAKFLSLFPPPILRLSFSHSLHSSFPCTTTTTQCSPLFPATLIRHAAGSGMMRTRRTFVIIRTRVIHLVLTYKTHTRGMYWVRPRRYLREPRHPRGTRPQKPQPRATFEGRKKKEEEEELRKRMNKEKSQGLALLPSPSLLSLVQPQPQQPFVSLSKAVAGCGGVGGPKTPSFPTPASTSSLRGRGGGGGGGDDNAMLYLHLW